MVPAIGLCEVGTGHTGVDIIPVIVGLLGTAGGLQTLERVGGAPCNLVESDLYPGWSQSPARFGLVLKFCCASRILDPTNVLRPLRPRRRT